MYFRTSRKTVQGKTFSSVQLVHTIRHPVSRKPTTRVLASLGDLSSLDDDKRLALIVSLSRALGLMEVVRFSGDELALADLAGATAKTRSVGAVWACLEVLRQIHLPDIWNELVARRDNASSLCRHLTTLICHRLDDPGSKLSLLRWLEGVLIPGIDAEDISYQGLLRTMDALIEHKAAIEKALANRILTMFDTELDLVLMDVTSVSVCSRAEEHALFAYGYSRDGHPERKQYVLLMVTTKDGIPLYHDIHPGSTADTTLLDATMKEVRRLFPQVDRCMVVADRGMLSVENLRSLTSLRFEHLVAMPLKREKETRQIIERTHAELLQRARAVGQAEPGDEDCDGEAMTEEEVEDGRVVVAFSMKVARQQARTREARLDAFDDRAALLEARLQGKVKTTGRPLTDVGAFKQLVAEALQRKVTAYFKIELTKANTLWVEPLDDAIEYAEKCDGKLALHTNNQSLAAEELYRVYKDLQEIERSWHVLKSQLKIRPTFHYTERRVRAHVFVCVLALMVERVMRLRLKAARHEASPVRALEKLRRLTHVRIELHSGEKQDILANRQPEQMRLFEALGVEPFTETRLRQLAV